MPRTTSKQSAPINVEVGLSVLKIAFALEIDYIFKETVRDLDKLIEDHVQRLEFAKSFRIVDWIRPSLRHLITREQPLSSAEADRLGSFYAVNVIRLRELHRPQFVVCRSEGLPPLNVKPSKCLLDVSGDILTEIEKLDIGSRLGTRWIVLGLSVYND